MVMSLPAGVGDNDKCYSTLYGGINLIPNVACPNQDEFTIVLRVTDAGATNGPYQDFTYTIPIGSFASGVPDDPPPVPDQSIVGMSFGLQF
jgi:hypothetical protein